MEKEQILSLIRSSVAEGKVSFDEVVATLGHQISRQGNDTALNSVKMGKNVSKILYFTGTLIVVIGIIILISQNWNGIGIPGRLLVTLGVSFISLCAGLYFSKQVDHNSLSVTFLTISASLAPVGAYVLADSLGFRFDDVSVQATTAFMLLCVFLSALYVAKKDILIFVCGSFFTWLYYALTLKILSDSNSYNDYDTLQIVTIILGISYVCFAYYLSISNREEREGKQRIANIYYGLGTIGILLPTILWNGVWNMLYIGLVFFAVMGSVYFKSRAMLTFSALFLVAYIIKITSKYFTNSMSWPIALVFLGFVVIGIGYSTFYLNRKYMGHSTNA